MASRRSRILLFLVLAAGVAAAQDATPPAPSAPDAGPAEPKQAAAGSEEQPAAEAVKEEEEKIKVLRPNEIPAELARLKSKADIKAEVSVLTTSGQPIVFKGVIRNGKLIERIVDRRFVPEQTLDHARCGVRLWWSGGSDGYIFFRYSSIKTLSITGRLTDEERREILERLKAKREGRDDPTQAIPATTAEPKLDKMSEAELEAHLLRQYPYDKGWDQKRYRELRRKQLMDNQPLTETETTFVQYFHVLAQARFKALKQSSQKINIEPGSAEKPAPAPERKPAPAPAPEEDDLPPPPEDDLPPPPEEE
jgi:hypothetical protein